MTAALFKADRTVTLTLTADHGKIRVQFSGWPDPKVVQANHVFEVSLGPLGIEGRT
jgi:hypothetical protein